MQTPNLHTGSDGKPMWRFSEQFEIKLYTSPRKSIKTKFLLELQEGWYEKDIESKICYGKSCWMVQAARHMVFSFKRMYANCLCWRLCSQGRVVSDIWFGDFNIFKVFVRVSLFFYLFLESFPLDFLTLCWKRPGLFV